MRLKENRDDSIQGAGLATSSHGILSDSSAPQPCITFSPSIIPSGDSVVFKESFFSARSSLTLTIHRRSLCGGGA